VATETLEAIPSVEFPLAAESVVLVMPVESAVVAEAAQPNPARVYTHTLESGEVVEGTLDGAMRKCPVLGKMSIEQAQATLDQDDFARRIAERGARIRAAEQPDQSPERQPEARTASKDSEDKRKTSATIQPHTKTETTVTAPVVKAEATPAEPPLSHAQQQFIDCPPVRPVIKQIMTAEPAPLSAAVKEQIRSIPRPATRPVMDDRIIEELTKPKLPLPVHREAAPPAVLKAPATRATPEAAPLSPSLPLEAIEIPALLEAEADNATIEPETPDVMEIQAEIDGEVINLESEMTTAGQEVPEYDDQEASSDASEEIAHLGPEPYETAIEPVNVALAEGPVEDTLVEALPSDEFAEPVPDVLPEIMAIESVDSNPFAEFLRSQEFPEEAPILETVTAPAPDKPLEDTLTELAVYLANTPMSPEASNAKPETAAQDEVIRTTIKEIVVELDAIPLISEGLYQPLAPELTHKILFLLLQLGYENPQEALEQFTSGHSLEFLLQAIRYLHQLLAEYNRQEFLSQTPSSWPIMIASLPRLGRAILTLLARSPESTLIVS
jgi:hypothetical protein